MWVFRHAPFGNNTRTFRTEFNMSVITTVPNVSYHAFTKKSPNDVIWVNNPSDLPDPRIRSC